jgi:hypothetical protein
MKLICISALHPDSAIVVYVRGRAASSVPCGLFKSGWSCVWNVLNGVRRTWERPMRSVTDETALKEEREKKKRERERERETKRITKRFRWPSLLQKVFFKTCHGVRDRSDSFKSLIDSCSLTRNWTVTIVESCFNETLWDILPRLGGITSLWRFRQCHPRPRDRKTPRLPRCRFTEKRHLFHTNSWMASL